MKRTIAVLDYGMGNIHSIVKALRLFHDDVRFTADVSDLQSAAAVVLPGDGAFAAAMDHLNGRFSEVVADIVHRGRPLLGVCIGFQVLFQSSDEFSRGRPGEVVPGLGLIPGHIRRFPSGAGVRVPHMGWNQLVEARGVMEDWNEQHMYFIHSYRAVEVPEQFVVARCSYAGESFAAAVEHENITGFQFHPEKSDRAGLDLLESWTRRVLAKPGAGHRGA